MTGEDAAAVAPGATHVSEFIYTPIDAANATVNPLTIVVYTSDAWAAANAEAGAGTEIAQGDGIVFVAVTPASNPYAEGSEDYTNFDALFGTVDDALSTFAVVE